MTKRHKAFDKITVLFLALFLLISSAKAGRCETINVNLDFIDSKQETVTLADGKEVQLWKTVNQELLDREIIATLDDNALVARVYLKHYELTKDRESLKKARAALRFIYHMQKSDGTFYRYMKSDGEIDRIADDGAPTLGIHTAKAYVTIAYAAGILREANSGDRNRAEDSFLLTTGAIRKWMAAPDTQINTYVEYEKMKIPKWLIMGRGDISSMYLLGMSLFCEKYPFQKVTLTAKDLGRAVMEFKNHNPEIFPEYAHLSFTDKPFHLKTANAFQPAALAAGGRLFGREAWVGEAEREAIGFLLHHTVSGGPAAGYYPRPVDLPQTAEGAYTLVYNYKTLARILKDDSFNVAAGLSAAWFINNNPSEKRVYRESDGSGYTFVDSEGPGGGRTVSSSAYALLSLMEVMKTPGEKYLDFKPVEVHTKRLLESEDGTIVHKDFEVKDWEYPGKHSEKAVIISRRNTFWHKIKIDVDDEYFLLMAYQKQPLFSSAVAVNVRIDGGPILLISQGGATGEPHMLYRRITTPENLAPGLHTIGVRYRGLLMTKPAIVDCLVLQPVLERTTFADPSGRRLMLVKNWSRERKKLHLKEEVLQEKPVIKVRGIDGKTIENPLREKKNKKFVLIPSEGFGIIEWQGGNLE